MSGGKETPRQKMIGMMYLVLTALLAMNVSKEILNSFIIVNNGLVKTNENFDAKNSVTYTAFDLAMLNDEVKTKPFYDRAIAAKKLSSDLDKYIKDIKVELLWELQQLPKEVADTFPLSKLDSKDNYDIPTHYMMGEGVDKATDKGKAREFKEKIRKYKDDMLNLVPPKERANVRIGLNVDDVYSNFEEKMISWENNNFYHNPAAAVFTILSKMQNDIKNAEGDIINMLYKSVSAADFKFDTLAAKVIAPTSYVLIGDEYRADVFVAAFSTTQNPQILIGQVDTATNKIAGKVDSIPVDRGVGQYVVKPTSEGLVQWSGIINVKSPDNTIKSYPFKSEYMVARPAIVVSPDKMNVFYIGPDNPVSISVPGVPADNLQPSLSGGGTISGSKGKYIVRVTNPGEVTVNVSAKMKDGTKSMGPGIKFRVKRVPDPVGYVSGKKGDEVIAKSELMAIQGVSAKLENFDFDLKFDVVSFDVSMNLKGVFVTASAQGNRITTEMAGYLKAAGTGSKVYFENIKAKGPDGTTRKISGVNLKVK